ncbi:hypothetical protein BOTCAL_0292g00160 [Botryotinia calthae]|uniref:Uncharacterized protein n=1 Tax=Botryotinia calthae TaxID=38488 RepID=A0A4Y8CXE5_9HELO|nr:hypothetical protein BOTCAL_0292g00160 [Botryotinia calthae]
MSANVTARCLVNKRRATGVEIWDLSNGSRKSDPPLQVPTTGAITGTPKGRNSTAASMPNNISA